MLSSDALGHFVKQPAKTYQFCIIRYELQLALSEDIVKRSHICWTMLRPGQCCDSERLEQHPAYSLKPFSLALLTSLQYLCAVASLILLPHLTIPNRLAFQTNPITATVTYVFRYPVASSQGVMA